jgi:hypothetical protein
MDRMIRNPTWGTGIPPGIPNDEARHASSGKLLLKTAKGMVTFISNIDFRQKNLICLPSRIFDICGTL